MSLSIIVKALGGDLYEGGRRANVPAPGHSPADRSVSLLLVGDRVVIHGFGRTDWRAVRDDLRGRGLIDAQGRLGCEAGAPIAPAALSRPGREAVARALWAEAGPVAGSLSEQHALGRGLAGALSEALRHHGRVPAAVYAGAGPQRPALLAAITDAGGSLRGVEITYLAADGGRARMTVPRKIVGSCPAGAAVRLQAAGPRLLVGEGVFTCLSAAQLFGLPAWALLSAGNLRVWRPPPSVRSVLIAADRGAVGEVAARVLASRLQADGVAVESRWPPWPHADWNEALRGGAAVEGGGRAGKGGRGGRMVRIAGPETEP